eukprot:jgi/Bigna1/77825/fgenesh1_pg.50_\
MADEKVPTRRMARPSSLHSIQASPRSRSSRSDMSRAVAQALLDGGERLLRAGNYKNALLCFLAVPKASDKNASTRLGKLALIRANMTRALAYRVAGNAKRFHAESWAALMTAHNLKLKGGLVQALCEYVGHLESADFAQASGILAELSKILEKENSSSSSSHVSTRALIKACHAHLLLLYGSFSPSSAPSSLRLARRAEASLEAQTGAPDFLKQYVRLIILCAEGRKANLIGMEDAMKKLRSCLVEEGAATSSSSTTTTGGGGGGGGRKRKQPPISLSSSSSSSGSPLKRREHSSRNAIATEESSNSAATTSMALKHLQPAKPTSPRPPSPSSASCSPSLSSAPMVVNGIRVHWPPQFRRLLLLPLCAMFDGFVLRLQAKLSLSVTSFSKATSITSAAASSMAKKEEEEVKKEEGDTAKGGSGGKRGVSQSLMFA